VLSVTSRACEKFLEEAQSVTSRACEKFLEEAQSATSRACWIITRLFLQLFLVRTLMLAAQAHSPFHPNERNAMTNIRDEVVTAVFSLPIQTLSCCLQTFIQIFEDRVNGKRSEQSVKNAKKKACVLPSRFFKFWPRIWRALLRSGLLI
jgi:hypothetical protein